MSARGVTRVPPAIVVAAVTTTLLVGPTPAAHAGDVRIGPATAPANLLSSPQASLDGIPSGLAAAAGTALSVVSAPTHGGSGALALTNTAAVTTNVAMTSGVNAASWTAAHPGTRYTGRFWGQAEQASRDVLASLAFYDAEGVKLAGVPGQPVQDTRGAWRQTPATVAVAPAGAAYVALTAIVRGTLPGETHLVDDLSITSAPGGAPAVVGPLTTSGNQILDGNGRPLILRGFTRSGLEGLDLAGPTQYDIGRAKAWGANVIRVPLGEQSWLSTSCEFNPGYAGRVDDTVRWITELGMVALIDLHWNTLTECGQASQQPMADYPNAITFWQQVASRYQSNPLVAFDLYNEPHHISDSVWRNGGSVTWKDTTYVAAGMQQMYDAVRGTGAANLITVSGNNWANTLPAASLRLVGSNIAYAVHAYTCPGSPPPTCTNSAPYNPGQILNSWVTPSETVPVVVTEFGWPDPTNGTYAANVIAFAEAHGWGWLNYTWGNATWGPFSLLSTAGPGASFEPNAGGMPALAGFPGFASPQLTEPIDGTTNGRSVLSTRGTSQPSSLVTIYDGATKVGQVQAGADGGWSADIGPLGDGVHALTTTAGDSGGISAASAPVRVTVDTTAPAAPVIHRPVTGTASDSAAITVAGSAEPGSVIEVRDDGRTIGTTTSDSAGTWALPVAMPDGPHLLEATATDQAGRRSGPSQEIAFAIDATAPATPTIDEPGDQTVLDDPEAVVRGTAEPGSTVVLAVDDLVVASVTTDANGGWSATPTMSEGDHVLRVTATDALGNTSVPTADLRLSVDTTAPGTPRIALPTPATTNLSTITLSGTAVPGSVVTLYDNDNAVATADTSPDGSWTATVPFGDGTHGLTAVAASDDGTTTPASRPVQFVVDTQAPGTPMLAAPVGTDWLANGEVSVVGTAEPGSTIRIYDTATAGAAPIASAEADVLGHWTTTTPALVEGRHEITATSTDLAQNTSPASPSARVWIDTHAPAAPRVNAPAGFLMSAAGTVQVAGEAEPASTVVVRDGDTPVAQATTDGLGSWSTAVRLGGGTHTLTVAATDPAGNASAASAPVSVVVQTGGPGTSQRTGNGNLAFASTRDGASEIYTMRPDGRSPVRRTKTRGSNTEPQWSPDGTSIVFTSTRDNNSEIYVMRANGSHPRRLTTSSAPDSNPAWSPDGTSIAFTRTTRGNSDIYVMHSDGTHVRRLTSGSAADRNPAWSPDGTRIAFTRTTGGNSDIYVMTAVGDGLRRFTSGRAADDMAAWSPDGSNIAFQRRATRTQICVLGVEHRTLRVLTPTGTFNGYPGWSPDGRRIVFTSTRYGNSDVFAMTTTGRSVTRLTRTVRTDTTPSWQPV